MDISLNARVSGTDGPIGKSVRAIINPVTETITHITVQPDGMGETEHMVPLEAISDSSTGEITLNVSKNQFFLYPLFVRRRFVDLEEAGIEPGEIDGLPEADEAMDHAFWPFVTAEGHMGTYEEVEQIPTDELAIHRGDPVQATDGRVGEVSELVINPENAKVSHLVLQKGHIFGRKQVAVPVSDIDRVDERIVYLKIDKAAVKDLSELNLRR